MKRIPVASTPAPASKKAKVEAAKAPASAPPKMQKQQEKQAAAAQKKGGQAPAAGEEIGQLGRLPSACGDKLHSAHVCVVVVKH